MIVMAVTAFEFIASVVGLDFPEFQGKVGLSRYPILQCAAEAVRYCRTICWHLIAHEACEPPLSEGLIDAVRKYQSIR